MAATSIHDHYTTHEGSLSLPDGHGLYTKSWLPTQPAKARLVFVHGFSDHCNFYGVLFPELAKHAIATYSFDQRGWGRSVHSPSQKGLTGSTQVVMDDITHFIKSLPKEDGEETPLFLMGHSMGGGQVLYYAAKGDAEVKKTIRGYLGEAPSIALREKPNIVVSTLGRLAGKVLPHRQMLQKLDATKICRDPDVCKEWDADALCHDTGTLEGLAGMLDRAAELEEGKARIDESCGEGGKTRLWIGFGTGDHILSEPVCRKWFEGLKVEDKEYKVYEGWYHKLHAEPGDDKFTFANDVARWIVDRSGAVDALGGVVGKPKL
ncbi:Putative monoglyceride lipase [Fulvia fulva]|uniref:Monoglyceride lipase n=1 Tax=Passalora fulva TaxID=5499 RepID=A0A9Q8L7X6_PASFU|nr:Putative monoglyceride lipase [Fulvia fulva]KAK4635425.1 putative monoglyceride lipase [Fulvia fulva]KAK4636914.1 putative monoglyceride lipase [Fulvia fulva]UJO12546.1 Putative monoglyceride lipase [Fulvia fulva]WPV09886.1 Putative monoglyceride lipase [Fulvia fulva]WPV25284.1 Putative monoglyceride lipase [Fulvia fulva]